LRDLPRCPEFTDPYSNPFLKFTRLVGIHLNQCVQV
jgi:hypothetical protein